MKLSGSHLFSISFTIISLLNSCVFSQALGIGGGVNLSNLHFFDPDNNGYYDNYNSITSLHAGIYYNLDFNESMGLRLCVGYSAKGFEYKSEISNEYTIGNQVFSEFSKIQSKTRLDYIQFTPMFKYRLEIGELGAFYALIGPYVSVGVSGRSTEEQMYFYSNPFTTIDLNDYNSEIIQFGRDGDGYNYLDFGFTPGIGFQWNKVFLEVVYDFGLNNIDAFNDEDYKIFNRTISIEMGVVFGK